MLRKKIIEIGNDLAVKKLNEEDIVIALAGNPNVGKSTIFNELTGLNQHTGNWPGKTVVNAQGSYNYQNENYILVDLPGTYSLKSHSLEEEVARDFICFGRADLVIVVCDATSLEKNLNLVLQTLEITSNVILCLNLMDEAKKKKIEIDVKKLEEILKIPVVVTTARSKVGLEELKAKIKEVSKNPIIRQNPVVTYPLILEAGIINIEKQLQKNQEITVDKRWLSLKLLTSDLPERYRSYFTPEIESKVARINNSLRQNNAIKNSIEDIIVTTIINKTEEISKETIRNHNMFRSNFDSKLDSIVTHKVYGVLIMLGLLSIIFFLTLVGSNYPSKILSQLFASGEKELLSFFSFIKIPKFLAELLILGVYRTLTWVVAVMLPPMAIFFPLFTLLEDFGYLPRLAFNLDGSFNKCSACGKQSLTMCMGLGCNAVGVIGARIINSPRERLIAILTNSFIPCNGRFPMLLVIISIFFAGINNSLGGNIISTLILTGLIILAIALTLIFSKLLSLTILKGETSSFILELPPYRKPQIIKVIYRSIFDRTLFVLSRAIIIAIPAGLIIFLMSNVYLGSSSIFEIVSSFLNPVGLIIGLDGIILLAFILGIPANEIVLPIMIMAYTSSGNLVDIENLASFKEILLFNGWSITTAICFLVFALFHSPCSTTLLTIKKETNSWKWTLVSFLLPTLTGIFLCLGINFILSIF